MKKVTFLAFFLTITFFTSAQSYIGFLSDNYSGVHGIISNPANITDSPFKIDINIAGLSAFAGNDYYGVNVFDALKKGYSFDLEAKASPSMDNNAAFNLDFLGPAFMFNLSEKSSIAIFTRARSFMNANEINGASIAAIDDASTDDFNVNEGDINGLGHAWAEVGMTYARVLFNKRQHFLKGGLTLKYLKGLGSAYVVGNNVTIDYDADGTDLGGGETTGSIASTGFVNYGRYDEFDNDDFDYEIPDNANGFGADLGFVYEWRPNYGDNTTYKLKIGVSVTDIGNINYKDGVREGYNISNTNVSEEDLNNSNNLGDFLETFYTLTDSDIGYKIDLPSALHLNVDWSIHEKIYLNLNTDFSLMSKNRKTANRISNITSLTPRYETKWVSFYLPLSVIENNGFRVGAGLRVGSLYLGSGSLISALTNDNNKEADVYAGLKIPLYHNVSKDKDKDKDGVIDSLDNCPKEPGPVENNGCPWEDRDNDGLLDNVDECPEEAGPKENNGCPWEDRDGDGIYDKDDVCPYLVGTEENNGCPFRDTDGDGVYDKDDDCINEAGTAANNGCPEEVLEKLQKTLNDYAKVILFNPDATSISASSNETLYEIIKVLNEYPNARFTIEGHTDSIGSYEFNQTLSEARAQAVKTFLVENGIDSSRLTAVGYGERRPIATNMYKPGRAQNRRVEINLVKNK